MGLDKKNSAETEPLAIAKPPLKWAGAKTKLVPRLLALIPAGTKRLIEPFAGSAVLSLNAPVKELLIADVNADLIHLYETIRDQHDEFVAYAQRRFTSQYNTRESYDRLRKAFNSRELPRLEHSAHFLYLNRHGFNGLCRYNSSGGFNVPFGQIKTPHFPTVQLKTARAVFARAELRCAGFLEIIALAKKGDFLYCDPPYSPLTQASNFTQYATASFGPTEHLMLAKACEEAAERGATVAISNHDTLETRALYATADEIQSLAVQRFISCNGESRNKVQELIAVFHPRGSKRVGSTERHAAKAEAAATEFV